MKKKRKLKVIYYPKMYSILILQAVWFLFNYINDIVKYGEETWWTTFLLYFFIVTVFYNIYAEMQDIKFKRSK